MDINADFKQLLTDFFKIYHPRQEKKVDLITAEFPNQKVEVMARLCDKYKVVKSKIKGLQESLEELNAKPVTPVIENTAEEVEEISDEASLNEEISEDEEIEEEGKKSKKKKK